MTVNVLTIAGSDPSGGAGIQADLKTFSACGVYGMAVVTALTAQNTQGVQSSMEVPADFVSEQISVLKTDIVINAIKTGMLSSAAIIKAVVSEISNINAPIVVDPVMVSKSGHHLLKPEAVRTLKELLLPLATIVTPNLPEAAVLSGMEEAQNIDEMKEQAHRLLAMGAKAVLMKGGHLSAESSPDLLVTANEASLLEGVRHNTKNTHGTGCTLSSSIASFLARGESLTKAVTLAKSYLNKAIKEADNLDVGKGHGPVHHFANLWPTEL